MTIRPAASSALSVDSLRIGMAGGAPTYSVPVDDDLRVEVVNTPGAPARAHLVLATELGMEVALDLAGGAAPVLRHALGEGVSWSHDGSFRLDPGEFWRPLRAFSRSGEVVLAERRNQHLGIRTSRGALEYRRQNDQVGLGPLHLWSSNGSLWARGGAGQSMAFHRSSNQVFVQGSYPSQTYTITRMNNQTYVQAGDGRAWSVTRQNNQVYVRGPATGFTLTSLNNQLYSEGSARWTATRLNQQTWVETRNGTVVLTPHGRDHLITGPEGWTVQRT